MGRPVLLLTPEGEEHSAIMPVEGGGVGPCGGVSIMFRLLRYYVRNVARFR